MPASLDTSEIVRLLQEYEQLSQDGKDCGPTVAILARETRFPDLEQFLRSELLEKHRAVRDVAYRLFWHSPLPHQCRPPVPARTLEARIFRGAAFGLSWGLGGACIAGFLFGAVTGAAPCGSAPNFLAGGLFAATMFSVVFGIPIGAVSALVGAILGAFTPQHR